jgi:hypothetical protein
VRFRIEQHFVAALEEVEAAFVDPAFLEELGTLPKLGRPELVDQREDGDLVHQRVRYAFAGELASAVTAVVDPVKLTWVEQSTLDRRTHRTRFTIVPDHYKSRLSCDGEFVLDSTDAGTRRVATGELKVRFPLVGGKVERAIVSGLEEHAEREVDAMARWLSR